MDSYDNDLRFSIDRAEGRVAVLEDRVRALSADLARTQEALRLALAALAALGHPVDLSAGAQFGQEPPATVRNWKMKPLE